MKINSYFFSLLFIPFYLSISDDNEVLGEGRILNESIKFIEVESFTDETKELKDFFIKISDEH